MLNVLNGDEKLCLVKILVYEIKKMKLYLDKC